MCLKSIRIDFYGSSNRMVFGDSKKLFKSMDFIKAIFCKIFTHMVLFLINLVKDGGSKKFKLNLIIAHISSFLFQRPKFFTILRFEINAVWNVL